MSDEEIGAGRCGTCTYWKPSDDGEHLVVEDGEYVWVDDDDPMADYEPAPGQWGECKRVSEFGPRQGSSDRFYVNDGSHYHAQLNTRDDFGCVDHAPTPPDTVGDA